MTDPTSSLRRHHRTALLLLAALSYVLRAAPPAQAEEPVLLIEGRGSGHGVGMSQEGAKTMGAAGASTAEILARFYPGTTPGAADGTLRVSVFDSAQRSQTLAFPGGGEIRATAGGVEPAGFPVVVAPGGAVDVLRDESGYHVSFRRRTSATATGTPPTLLISAVAERSPVDTVPSAAAPSSTSMTGPAPVAPTTTSTAVPPTTTSTAGLGARSSTTVARPAPPAAAPVSGLGVPGPLWSVPRTGETTVLVSRGRRYRGTIEVSASESGGLKLINHVDIEAYLRGMGEVLDPSWAPAALRAQAIAARTYALRSVAAGTEICDDDHCQVYVGQSAEYGAMDRAVHETRGEVLRYGGALASTVYSANSGGISATPAEGFGSDDAAYPYLPSVTYPTADPDPWTASAGLAAVGRRLGYPGSLTGARISARGPSGRATEVTLDGDAGPMAVDGRTVAFRLGLKSTLFSLRRTVGEPLPLPEPVDAGFSWPAPAFPIQAPPELQGGSLSPPISERQSWNWQLPALFLLLAADAALIGLRARRRSAVVIAEPIGIGRRRR